MLKPLYAVPDQWEQLNQRSLASDHMIIHGRLFPDNGTFAQFFNALLHNDVVTELHEDGTLTIREKARQLVLSDILSLSVTLEAIDANRIVWTMDYGGAVYRTVIRVITPTYNFSLRISGAKAGRYLLEQTHTFIKDPLNIRQIPYSDNEYELTKWLNERHIV
jgi:hypothetical protein